MRTLTLFVFACLLASHGANAGCDDWVANYTSTCEDNDKAGPGCSWPSCMNLAGPAFDEAIGSFWDRPQLRIKVNLLEQTDKLICIALGDWHPGACGRGSASIPIGPSAWGNIVLSGTGPYVSAVLCTGSPAICPRNAKFELTIGD